MHRGGSRRTTKAQLRPPLQSPRQVTTKKAEEEEEGGTVHRQRMQPWQLRRWKHDAAAAGVWNRG